jgi:hypothetical protein
VLDFPDRSQGQCDEQAFTRESSVSTLIFTVVFYSYVHTMFGSFLPPPPTHFLYPPMQSLPPTPSLPSRNDFALISDFLVERV